MLLDKNTELDICEEGRKGKNERDLGKLIQVVIVLVGWGVKTLCILENYLADGLNKCVSPPFFICLVQDTRLGFFSPLLLSLCSTRMTADVFILLVVALKPRVI